MKINWLLIVIIFLSTISIVSGIIVHLYQRNKNRPSIQDEEDDPPFDKDIEELPTGVTIIVIDFNAEDKPIVEFADEYAAGLDQAYRNFITLQNAERFTLEKGKTYEVERMSEDDLVNLKQITLLLDS